MKRVTFASVAAVLAVLAAGCHENLGPVAPDADRSHASLAPSDGFVAAPDVEMRKVTTMIRVAPPRELRYSFELAAARSSDPDFAAFLRGFAAGGSGSGFVVVYQRGARQAEFVVTNRHVVQMAEQTQIGFVDGQSFSGCEIVYTDPAHDLAVLAFPRGQRPVPYGVRPASNPARDRQTVVATGFPAFGSEPRYQTTEGKVSNERFELRSGDEPLTFIQHTAAIDPGSSGGPLTNERGELVGVNTMMGKNRHSAFFAVPASAVDAAVRTAFEIQEGRASASWKKQRLVQACRVLTSELASKHPRVEVLSDLISNRAVARHGMQSFAPLAREPRMARLFTQDPMTGLRAAVLLRVAAGFDRAGGLDASNTCADLNVTDEATLTTARAVRMTVQLRGRPVEIEWTFEHGHWRVAGGDLLGGA